MNQPIFSVFSSVLKRAKRRRKELKRSRRAPTIYAEIRQKSRQEAPLAPFQRRARREMRMLSSSALCEKREYPTVPMILFAGWGPHIHIILHYVTFESRNTIRIRFILRYPWDRRFGMLRAGETGLRSMGKPPSLRGMTIDRIEAILSHQAP